jgi:dihydrofolate reductase
MTNIVYIATSMDGYIADSQGGIDWLESVPAPPDDDLGWEDFICRVDALVMGRISFESVIGFDVGWPYPVPGIILSSTMKSAPKELADHVTFAQGSPEQIVSRAADLGYANLYIDGGKTIQRFLQADLIDELIVTEIPILLGGGIPLFGGLDQSLMFELVETKVLLNQLVKKHHKRKRD